MLKAFIKLERLDKGWGARLGGIRNQMEKANPFALRGRFRLVGAYGVFPLDRRGALSNGRGGFGAGGDAFLRRRKVNSCPDKKK